MTNHVLTMYHENVMNQQGEHFVLVDDIVKFFTVTWVWKINRTHALRSIAGFISHLIPMLCGRSHVSLLSHGLGTRLVSSAMMSLASQTHFPLCLACEITL